MMCAHRNDGRVWTGDESRSISESDECDDEATRSDSRALVVLPAVGELGFKRDKRVVSPCGSAPRKIESALEPAFGSLECINCGGVKGVRGASSSAEPAALACKTASA